MDTSSITMLALVVVFYIVLFLTIYLFLKVKGFLYIEPNNVFKLPLKLDALELINTIDISKDSSRSTIHFVVLLPSIKEQSRQYPNPSEILDNLSVLVSRVNDRFISIMSNQLPVIYSTNIEEFIKKISFDISDCLSQTIDENLSFSNEDRQCAFLIDITLDAVNSRIQFNYFEKIIAEQLLFAT